MIPLQGQYNPGPDVPRSRVCPDCDVCWTSTDTRCWLCHADRDPSPSYSFTNPTGPRPDAVGTVLHL